jgi:DNA polymerase-4
MAEKFRSSIGNTKKVLNLRKSKKMAELRDILHVDMDAFFVSVEEVLDPSLKGKPVVVGGDPEGRGVVSAASYAARKFGIHSAMPLVKAKRLCPHAIFLQGSHGVYGEFSRRVFKVLETFSPLVEKMSLDEAYVDLTGCGKLHGPALEAAEKIRNQIKKEVGINASIGIASNKLLAKVASAFVKPSGILWIAPGKEKKFLEPLPVSRIPGVGPKSNARFKRMGIKTVGDLTALPKELLEETHGKWGSGLYWKSRGVCNSPVVGVEEDSRSISRETTFATDSGDARFLESKLSYLVEKAAGQLRGSELYARRVTLKLRTPDFKTVTRSHTLTQPTSEDHVIIGIVLQLFKKLFTGRTRVRLIGVALTSLTRDSSVQTDLFEHTSHEQWDDLYQGIDRIRKKYGFQSILRASSRGSDY